MTRRVDATRTARRGTRRSRGPDARVLDVAGIFNSREFIARGLDALLRVQRVAAILRGDLLRAEEMCQEPTGAGWERLRA